MITAAQKTTKLTPGGELERVGIHQMNNIFEGIQPWIWAMGGNILNKSGDECKLDSEGSIKAISLIADMINKSKILSFGFRGKWLPTLGQESRFAMAIWWNNVTGYLQEVGVPWPLAEVPFPPGPMSDKTVVAYVHVAGISKQCRDKEAAWELLKFLAGKEVAYAISRAGLSMAFRKDSIQVWGEGMIANKVAGAQFILDGMQRMRTSERSVAHQLAVDEIHRTLNDIWAQKGPAESLLPQLAKRLTAMLKKELQK